MSHYYDYSVFVHHKSIRSSGYSGNDDPVIIDRYISLNHAKDGGSNTAITADYRRSERMKQSENHRALTEKYSTVGERFG